MATKTKTPKVAKASEILFDMPANHGNNTPVTLDADAQAASMKKIQEVYQALSFVHDFIKGGTLTVSARFNGLSLAQRHLQDVKKMLGGDEDDAQIQENEVRHLRAANQENQRLREVMAQGVTAEAVGHKLYELKNTVYNWWKSVGFSYCKGSFDAHGNGGYLTVEFSVDVDDRLDFIELETPITSKKKKQEKIENIAEVLDIFGEDNYVVDCPKNRAWLINKLKTRFPSIRIVEIKSYAIHKTDMYHFREIKAYIDIDEIEEQA